MTRPVVVFDINGVLADVRKRSAHRPYGLRADLIIPSGQNVYMRPHLQLFANYILNMSQSPPIEQAPLFTIWTSRKQENAYMIEQYFESNFNLRFPLKLHGEDCIEYSGFHPLKDVRILRSKLGGALGRDAHVIFVDNSPERIKLDSNSTIVPVETFDSAYGETKRGLGGVIADLHSALLAIKNK